NTFKESGLLPELLKAVKALNFEIPMPVQQRVIPEILNNDRDMVALAQTGTGKTAAFGLPLIHRLNFVQNDPQVIILSPTRELCTQIAKDLESYGQFLAHFSVLAVYGGASIENQIRSLKNGVHIIVATPGRMNDLIRRKKVNLSNINTIVLDEADEMLNMGFSEDLNAILNLIPEPRRVLLFSATMPNEIANIASRYMHNPIEITIGTKNAGTENVKHHYYVVNAKDRYLALKRIADYYPDIYGIIFCRTRQETAEVAEKLMKDGYNADALHGDLSQAQRDYVMNKFRNKNLQMLVATDVAARGLDVDNLSHIINYNLPDDNEIYTHRSGRTGRAYQSGISISIVHSREQHRIHQLENIIKQKFERKNVPGGVDICKKQLHHLIQKMENVEINEQEINPFIPEVLKKTEHLEKEEVIKRFLSLEFNRFLEYYKNAPDLNVQEHKRGEDRERYTDERRSGSGFTALRISIGTMDGLTVPKLIGMVNDFSKNRKIKIGKANINSIFTLFEVENAFVDEVLNSLQGKVYAGRDLAVKIASNRDQPGNKQRSSHKPFFNERRSRSDVAQKDRKRFRRSKD
ncbi:MAG TPA: DEAD/DEAH box helicase, partial [Bacteroidales bacterium]|nr:DEAD/DEAH box helicase [Bacteroidales bacterium]